MFIYIVNILKLRMPALDTALSSSVIAMVQSLFKTKGRRVATLAVVVALTYFVRKRMQKVGVDLNEIEKEADIFVQKKEKSKSGKGNVDKKFFKRIIKLLKVVIPSWRSKEAGILLILSITLVVRTILSIQLAEVNGTVVHGIIKMDKKVFIRGLVTILAYAVPSSIINSLIDYLNVNIAM